MATREASKCATKIVRPLLSSDKSEAKKRVLNLYKTYYRQIPLMCKLHKVNTFTIFKICLQNLSCCSI